MNLLNFLTFSESYQRNRNALIASYSNDVQTHTEGRAEHSRR